MTGNNWAIVVGINEYEHLPSDDHLKYAVKDALAMQTFLCDQAQFPADNVLVCCDPQVVGTRRPSRSGLRDLLRNRLQSARGADNFWFFYAGHGVVHNHQDFLLPCDGNPYDLEETAVPISFVTDCLRDCEAHNVVLVLDMCRNRTRSTVEEGSRDVSTGMGEQTLEIAREQCMVTLFSCSRGQRSYEIKELEQGAFTHTLLAGLKESTTPRVLEQYLTNRVPALNRQYGKPVQVPLVVPEPGWKYDRPLLLSAATLFDLSLLATQARDAELDEDYELAEFLWRQVIVADQSTTSERATAMKAIGRLGVKRRGQPQSQSQQTPQPIPKTEPQLSLETASGSSQAVPPESSQASPTAPMPAQQASQAPLESQDFDGQSGKKDFFISYNRYDQHWAEWLAWTLEEAGYTVVLQAWDFRPGSNSVLDVQRATAECEKTIAVLSEPYLKAAYNQSEWATAFASDPQGLQRTLMPVRVGECEPGGLLKQLVYVDLVGVTEAAAHDLVLNALQERAKPAQKPGFPGVVEPVVERTEPEPVEFPGIEPTETNVDADLQAYLEAATAEGTKVTAEIIVEEQAEGTESVTVEDVVWLDDGISWSDILEKARQVVRPSPQLQTESKPSKVTSTTPALTTFVFEVVTVNAHQEIRHRRGQAQSFTEDLGKGVGLKMVSIPAGHFQMGSPVGEKDRDDSEGPQRQVRLNPFFIGKYPVTQGQWVVVSGLPKVNYELQPEPSRFKGAKRPVENISWDEAVEFCDRLSHKTGRQYRLPSEAEWEYACRAGTTTPYHFGSSLTTDLANYGSNQKQTTDVGSFPPNAFGLYDMHGNVWEWCLDHWHDNYQGAPSDGSPWVVGGNANIRPIRGGSCPDALWYCRSASRDFHSPDYHSPNYRRSSIGFRVVCSAP